MAPIGPVGVYATASATSGSRSQRETEAVGWRGWPLAADGAGSASVGDGALGLLGGDNRDREAERLHTMGEIAPEPARDARRKGGDNDFVEPASLDRLLHGDEGIAVADDPFDVATSGLVEQRDGQLECGRGH